ncbi:hypothetical protein OSK18_28330, partial [Escherichia coli]|nr:hypothetical protein [Escherichia coli]
LLGVEGPDSKVMKRVGVMPDYSSLYGSWTALDHLRFFSELSGARASKEKCLEVLRSVDLLLHANKKAGKLSFGMKKKLGIAQA